MIKQLLKETEIGDNMSIGCVLNEEEVELIVSTYEVSSSFLLNQQEWEELVKCINIANRTYRVETSTESDR